MRCLEIPLLTFFFLSCWGRPHREDPVLQYKQELVLRAERLRVLSMKESCRVGQEKRTLVNLHRHSHEVYPAHDRWHSTAVRGLGSQAHDGSDECCLELQNKGKNIHKNRDTAAKMESRTLGNRIHNNRYHKLISKKYLKKSLRRVTRTVKGQCTPLIGKRRYPRDTELGNSQRILSNYSVYFALHEKGPGSLYFPGEHSQLLLNPEAELQIHRETFTVELWVKPDGGQNDPAVIASRLNVHRLWSQRGTFMETVTGMFDNCSHVVSDRGWSVGIRPAVLGAKRDARFYFSLRTDRSQSATILLSPHRYKPGAWTHLAASYDGQQILLYVDGVLVSRAKGQLGPLHSPYISLCRSLMLGGDNSETGNHYRGHLFSLRLWSEIKTQHYLRMEALRRSSQMSQNSPLLQNLSILSSNIWNPHKDGVHPEILAGLIPKKDIVSALLLPPCGKTLCDMSDVTAGYSRSGVNWEKEIHYRVVNLCEDDGSRPLVSAEQIQRQHQALSNAYSPHGIHWQLNVIKIQNSTLRNRVVLPGCEPGRIGNDQCDPECKHPLTGYDGGDCGFFRPCSSRKKGDGVCHLECNTAIDDYDDGDCCPSKGTGNSTRTCFDPDAQGRAYMSVKELRDALQLNNTLFLNIFFAGSAGEELAGSATWPWDKDALSFQGGLVLNPSYYGMSGHTNTMIHEVGHALGLYHVFKGVSERESCDDPCSEIVPSMETGDLCADTAPTPKNKFCRDPDPTNDTCGPMFYTGTPYNNYMSYTDDDCANSFTPNQVSRMHCYLDLKYQGWTRSRKPSPVPLAPIVIKQTPDYLTIHWLPPISGELYERESGSECGSCTADRAFLQYAHQASSLRVCDNSGYWTPEEAVGPPDVDQSCQPSVQAWSPELHLFSTNMSVPCTQPQGCMLELHFLIPVQPQSLTIWITYLSPNLSSSVSDIELVTEHNESLHLGSMEAFCDTPLTIKLTTAKNVSRVRIYTFDARMEIDAALLVSMPHDPICSSCRPVKYRVLRNPPFLRDHLAKTQTHRFFTDMEVTLGQKYQYQVQVIAGTTIGESSPPLTHTHGVPFCGDGEVNEELGEQCDDGALHNEDGCSQRCQLEENYICRGEPSLCYAPSEDDASDLPDDSIGVSANCGGETSQKYIDQWASQAVASHEDPRKCPVSAVIGEPKRKSCLPFNGASRTHLFSWSPCNVFLEQRVWLKVSFDNPSLADSFLLYLSSDGRLPNSTPKVTSHLTDVSGQNHSLGTHELSCQKNPVVLSGLYGPKSPMYRVVSLTLTFSSSLIGVLGVALRSPANISHPGMGTNQPSIGQNCRSCSTLHVAHGSTQCSIDLDGEAQCSVTCDEGHVLYAVSKTGRRIVQDAVLKCSAGHWSMTVTCELLDCGSPSPSLVFHASFTCPDGTGLGKRCFFNCLPPAKFQGMSQWVTCTWYGLWSLPEGYCKIECDAPTPIGHAKLLTPRCMLGNQDVGSTCRYRCKPGYYVAEATERRPRRKLLKIHCLQTGLWAAGRCIPVICKPLPLILRGMYNCTRGLEVDSRCTLYCGSYTVSTVCSKDGTWTENLNLCKGLTGTCPPPPELNNIHYTCNHGLTIGANCTASCTYALNDPVILPENMTSDSIEQWMNPTRVQGIMCTGTLQWHPDPSTLHCIPSCEPFQADGWCDTINNRAYCQYDGGDCCASTLSSHKGQVVPFGAECEEDECTCRDPEAEENRSQRIEEPEPPLPAIGETLHPPAT
ncbi:pappalysin-2 isoform X2 [Mixophyes fleayi]|uniref:pappalysin-2 isoform X2 n=1 Tax=Mixophyes fleayi TaxID=3061075 RepID=UPI003F4DB1C2